MSSAAPLTSSNAHPIVVVIGDVVTDLVVRLSGPIAAASDTPSRIDARPGGSAANTAAWLAREGVDTRFIGAVGRDLFGSYHEEQLRRAGVTPHLTRGEHPTGTIVVLVDQDGERHMLPDRGANGALRADDLPADLFAPSRHLHLSGYTFFDKVTRPAALAALALAHAQGMTTSVDPSSVSLLRAVGATSFLEWTRGVDVIFPNLDEGLFLAGASHPEDAVDALCGFYDEVVLTMSADGALRGRRGEAVLHAEAPRTAVVDSTGAGDAFCAAYLASRLRGLDPAQALRCAADRGATATTLIGGRPPLPTP